MEIIFKGNKQKSLATVQRKQHRIWILGNKGRIVRKATKLGDLANNQDKKKK
jgi:hypothetical protein